MTESGSSGTKTLSESADSESTEGPLLYDRWTNNINYRQLVLSSCIGIFQMCWHPYVHDLRKLLPFLFLYQLFSILIAYPLFYLELALGVVTKKGVINCWDLAPVARGVGFAMLSVSMFCALAASAIGAWCLALLVHSFHVFLPWLHCAATADPPCAARHRPLPAGSETPPQSFFFNYVLDLKRDSIATGLGKVTWELTSYYIICWILIYFVVFKRVYSYSKMVLFKDVLCYFLLISCGVGVTQLQGAGRMFQQCDWGLIFESTQLWREAMEYSLIEMTIGQGSLAMLGSYCPKVQHKLGTTAMLSFVVAKSTSVVAALILGATHGALVKDYDAANTNISAGTSASMILWSDFVARVPGSQYWSALIFFTLFVLSITTAALSVQTVMSTFTGHSIKKITWAFLVVFCLLFCFIGVITLCTQGGLYLMDFLMMWPVTKPRAVIASVAASMVPYVYGQTTFCEDVYFAVGEYPSAFMRVCWALSPALMMMLFATGVPVTLATDEGTAGWLLAAFQILPILILLFFFTFFKFRVRNIVQEK